MGQKKKKILVIVGCVLFVAVIAIVGALLGKAEAGTKDELLEQAKAKEVAEGSGNSAQKPRGIIDIDGDEYAYYDQIESYLLLGTDHSGQESGQQEFQGDLADFILLLVINRTQKTYTALQIDRDTIVPVAIGLDEDGEITASLEQQICTGHWYGDDPKGCAANMTATVSAFLGEVKINGYYVLNMDDIPLLNHAIGGVQVTLEDDFSSWDPAMVKGATLELTDQQAEIFLHSRMGIGDGENTTRMARQRAYMDAFYQKAQGQIRQEPGFVNDIYRQLSEVAVTDLTGNDISKITNGLIEFKSRGIKNLQGERTVEESVTDGEKHVEIYVDEEEITEVLSEIYSLTPLDE
ncbi:MAG: LCP family protein [Lachnospiraceae bacterium]|nr:LCP family protein [Lachnospiraceae bacterium]